MHTIHLIIHSILTLRFIRDILVAMDIPDTGMDMVHGILAVLDMVRGRGIQAVLDMDPAVLVVPDTDTDLAVPVTGRGVG